MTVDVVCNEIPTRLTAELHEASGFHIRTCVLCER